MTTTATKSTAAKKSNVFNVVPSDPNRRIVLFSGREKDAREFVKNHFPRPHAEPGVNYDGGPQTDVVVVADGKKADDNSAVYYDGEYWSDDSDKPASEED